MHGTEIFQRKQTGSEEVHCIHADEGETLLIFRPIHYISVFVNVKIKLKSTSNVDEKMKSQLHMIKQGGLARQGYTK